MSEIKKHDTPMMEELKKGPFPSFVDDIEQYGEKHKKQACFDLLGQLELSYKHKETHWKHGGIVGVFGYGGGVIGRYSDQQDKFPAIWAFHTIRVNQPASKFYHTSALRKLCEMWDHRGSGMTNFHGSTGDIILLGTVTEQLEPVFFDLTHQLKMDLGGSGSNLRTPACCVGKARCEWSCIDTQELCYDLTMTYQDELHRPAFPYKFKFKISGCPNDCVASIARADFSIIGTWIDDIRIDQEAVKAYVGGELKPNAGAHAGRDWGKFDIQKEVIDLCPTQCMYWDGEKLHINNKECNRCMHCINVMPEALRPGTDTGATILMGAKAPILEGAQLSTVIVPFIRLEPPYDELKEIIENVWMFWMEEGKNRERLGELMQRVGLANFVETVKLKHVPQMIKEPRSNPYVFWKEEEVEGGWKRDIKEYRERHPA
ncbi:dissimilatory-type sulfite reductase subunit alpha [Thermodesulfatator autotrophicus]|uniref:Sulfite reductase, dissimilatory-type subunit alpha n=1 Tax=Thermodesulfatator autotrophicus TaxID=1795632 RepID=A0A177E6H5_9BACT|nr:dissimilatory-type sulfite reductase subunit alpha [Thermodesulfatator autotrophicus]OAG27563.1 sulfite reductase, dissimilatory-type subunit alpha [Thermodesulfatator autotrophicus]